ncbi:MAG: carbon storage regulator [Verrucomicrobia bacterium]|nr:carbon storage regulator [Verrucomicrobiota bacterium]MBS0646072.1 carbon storage regulator [Verrucomicrobiota bacterium]
MLVLTRKPEQKIKIGSDIIITVLKVQGDQVSIGIEAPKDQQIVRLELLDPNRKTNERTQTPNE